MNLIGPNWKTSLSGYSETIIAIISAICILPSDIWSSPKVYIPAILLIIAKTVKDTQTKDKNVTGGNTQQTLEGNYVAKGDQDLVDATLKSSPAKEQMAAIAQAAAKPVVLD